MKKAYALFLALGIASASLSSCGRSDYAFNSTKSAGLAAQPTQVAAPKPAEDGLATEAVVVAHKPVEAAPVSVAEASLPTQTQKNSATTVTATVTPTKAAETPKLNLVQRLALKSVAKKLNKIQNPKQATAGTAEAQSLKRTSIYLIIAGVLAILVGILIAGGSIAGGGNGAGFVIGAIVAYLGYIALVVGVILLIVALIRGH